MVTGLQIDEVGFILPGLISAFESNDQASEDLKQLVQKERIDTTITMYDFISEILDEEPVPGVLKNVDLIFSISRSEESSTINVDVSFENEKQLNEIFGYIENGRKGSMAQYADGFPHIRMDYSIDFENGIIKIPGIEIGGFSPEQEINEMRKLVLSKEEFTPSEQMELEERSRALQNKVMLAMLYEKDTELIINTPGSVIFTNDPNAIIKGNKVIFTNLISDMINEGGTIDRVIKFQN